MLTFSGRQTNKQTNKHTHSMNLNRYSENNIHSASQKFPAFMEAEGSLSCSQELATGPYSERDESHSFPRYFHNIHSNIILPPTPRSTEWSLIL